MLSESWWKQRFDNVSLENRGSYYEFTGKNEELLIDIREDPERRVRVGTIGSMSKENMEIWLTEQIRVYTESGTMGAIVQESNDQLIENLIEVMMTGFSKTHLVVSMERKIGDKWTPYCGVMAYVSDDDRTLSTVAKSDEIGVGTFWAIKTKKDFVFPKYGDKKSRQFVEMTRLWKKTMMS